MSEEVKVEGIKLAHAEYTAEYFASRIQPKIWQFITLEMLITTILFGSVVYLLKDFLQEGFFTNIALNSSIIATFFYTLFLLYRNNLSLYGVGRFIEDIETLEIEKDLTAKKIEKLAKDLTKKGSLINFHATSSIITHMDLNGFFCVNPHEGEQIKSLFQQRIGVRRGHIGFLSSVLVTLGLIGTFWGLILTISAIGGTLSSISGMFAEGGDNNIGALIDGVSGPLQGMGVAFSSSLFGLAGSLIVNVIGVLANKAQNRFFDKFSRWIDEHIPEINIDLAEQIHREGDSILPPEVIKDQEEIMKAFVLLSRDTHRHLNVLSNRLEALSTHTKIQEKALDELGDMRRSYIDLREHMSKHEKNMLKISGKALKDIGKYQSETYKGITKQQDASESINKALKSFEKSADTLVDAQKNIFDQHVSANNELNALNATLKGLNLSFDENQTIHLLKSLERTLSSIESHIEKQGETTQQLTQLLMSKG